MPCEKPPAEEADPRVQFRGICWSRAPGPSGLTRPGGDIWHPLGGVSSGAPGKDGTPRPHSSRVLEQIKGLWHFSFPAPSVPSWPPAFAARPGWRVVFGPSPLLTPGPSTPVSRSCSRPPPCAGCWPRSACCCGHLLPKPAPRFTDERAAQDGRLGRGHTGRRECGLSPAGVSPVLWVAVLS